MDGEETTRSAFQVDVQSQTTEELGQPSLPKMGTGEFLIFISDKQLLKELVQKPRLLFLTFYPVKSELHCSSFRLAVHCEIRADLCENTWVCLVDSKDTLELQLMKPLRGRCHLRCLGSNASILLHIWSIFYFHKWSGTKSRGKFNKKNEKKGSDVEKWPCLGLAQLECKLIGAFREKPVRESERNYGISLWMNNRSTVSH